MTTWTESARTTLEGHLARMHRHLLASGADPAEVKDDLRRHIDEEVASRRIGVVTTEDVETILSRIGLPAPVIDDFPRGERRTPTEPATTPPSLDPSSKPRAETPAVAARTPRPAERRRSGHWWLLIFGVILPLVTLGLELLTHMCAAAFFNPIPDVWHVLLVASVPAIHLLLWRAIRRGERRSRWLNAASAFALVVAAYYSVLYLTLAPLALFAIMFFGWGLLPLSPLFAFAASCRLRVLSGRVGHDGRGLLSIPATAPASPHAGVNGSVDRYRWDWAMGLGVAVVALTCIVAPPVLTRAWSQSYATGTAEEKLRAVRLLRSFGHDKTLLADCYGSTRWATENPFRFHAQGTPVDSNVAREIYYRATGQAFNELPPPQLDYGTRGWDALGEREWDSDQGGTAVGGRLRGLSVSQSRLDGLVDADAGWAYTEWILEFKNVATQEREARAQIALPPGGVVSRLTLWVDGEEREAAFAGSADVRQAYENVVKVVRRDPVLVTHSGPDRVLMQCYPVPENGGTIKVRLGITAPLELEHETSAILRWPRFIESNFNVADRFEHSVWVESAQALRPGQGRLTQDQSKPGVFALRGALRDEDLGEPASLVRIPRSAAIKTAWVPDPHSPPHFVRQNLLMTPAPRPGRVVLVVDGSKSMDPLLADVAEALTRLPDGLEFSLLLARDGVEELSGAARPTDPAFVREISERLARLRGTGGQDNGAALGRAWDLASERPGSVIIWVHGPQPIDTEQSETLRQRLEWRRPGHGGLGPVLHDVQVAPGLNRIAENLGRVNSLQALPRFGSIKEDLQRLFTGWNAGVSIATWQRERIEQTAVPESKRGKKSSRHLARLWARDEVGRLTENRRRDDAIRLAAQYQLVTPVSGAVVLETKQQFAQAGLQPVASETVPTVPEPGTIALLALGAGLVAWRALRQRSRVA